MLEEEIKKQLELFGIYEYLFGAINSCKALKDKVPNSLPVSVPVSNFNFLSENRELLKQAVERFSGIGIVIKLEGDKCIIG